MSSEEDGQLTPKKQKGEKWRKQHFSDSWLVDPVFSGWLAKDRNDINKAKCNACNTSLIAGKSELVKHSKAKKHIENVVKLKNMPTLTDV
jgi:hypothetical protein